MLFMFYYYCNKLVINNLTSFKPLNTKNKGALLLLLFRLSNDDRKLTLQLTNERANQATSEPVNKQTDKQANKQQRNRNKQTNSYRALPQHSKVQKGRTLIYVFSFA